MFYFHFDYFKYYSLQFIFLILIGLHLLYNCKYTLFFKLIYLKTFILLYIIYYIII